MYSTVPPIAHSLATVNREIAFVQAIISAGLMHTVTRRCSSGEPGSCKCPSTYQSQDASTRDNFKWNGCSDDVKSGSKLALHYLEDHESGHEINARIRRHNNEAGHHVSDFSVLRAPTHLLCLTGHQEDHGGDVQVSRRQWRLLHKNLLAQNWRVP